ncbi:thiaminase II [Halalkalibacterium halodurans]|jgi:thiaminase/transcriptional activator TenA|uniref:Aminopyrimidine aminohydrolase n=1 Tax=Halalkalibacterium halodurans TaxID=86665 RepID=A0A0M0KI99_ALKHA|nr:thiaminase II [Halalkalibacterium halodurans]TES55843.1 thiaminase II [Halalkalibacterium halodurans]TPE69450.1 thiaminase II [Halalkalibacterium halodurans]
MSFAASLYEKAQPIWKAGYNHPFVQGIGDGTLEKSKFQFFMKQDYLYLIDYARLFALGTLKGNDLQTMSTFSKLLHATLNVEMDLHRAYAKRLGISAEELEATEPAATTLAYTSYMLNVAQRGSLLDLIAAVLPCTWSYYEIGVKLKGIPGASDHPFYGEWIKLYASDEFKELADWLIQMLDEEAKGLSSKEKAKLETIFLTTSRLENEFWDMAYNERMWNYNG